MVLTHSLRNLAQDVVPEEVYDWMPTCKGHCYVLAYQSTTISRNSGLEAYVQEVVGLTKHIYSAVLTKYSWASVLGNEVNYKLLRLPHSTSNQAYDLTVCS